MHGDLGTDQMPAFGVTQIGSRTNDAPDSGVVSTAQPPPLPSMRVAKGARHRADEEDDELQHEWQRRAEETRARIAAQDERAKAEREARAAEDEAREWREMVALAKAADAVSEEDEWAALRAHVAEQNRIAEEREWQELMQRARAVPTVQPSATPWHVEPAPVAKVRPRVVAWP